MTVPNVQPHLQEIFTASGDQAVRNTRHLALGWFGFGMVLVVAGIPAPTGSVLLTLLGVAAIMVGVWMFWRSSEARAAHLREHLAVAHNSHLLACLHYEHHHWRWLDTTTHERRTLPKNMAFDALLERLGLDPTLISALHDANRQHQPVEAYGSWLIGTETLLVRADLNHLSPTHLIIQLYAEAAPDTTVPVISLHETASTVLVVREAWRRIVHHSPIATALLDSEGVIVRANLSFHSLTGLPIIMDEGAPQGTHTLLSVLLQQDRTNVQNALRQISEHRQFVVKPVEVKLSLEPEINAVVYFNPMRPQADDPLRESPEGYLVYFINTTEYKHLEQRFVQAQKMQAVGQLAGGIAHDFNNLLTAMIGFCDLLLIRHPPGEQSFADIMQIKQNANRAANLVRQLLAFSRKQTLQPQVIDITDTISELSNLLRRLLGERINLKLTHSRDLWNTKVDEGQLEQVIINLAVNARDAMDGMADAGLTITTANIRMDGEHPLPVNVVSATQEAEMPHGDYVLITIEDTGHGIPRHVIRHIFEPFFTTKKLGEGTGLGLATVYGIIQQTGGYIFVASEEGKGTCFYIYLPRHNDALDVHNTPHPALKKELEAHPTDLTGAGTILLVEDEDAVRMFSARALQNKGYSVLEADSGESALKVFAEHNGQIDLVITDVMMPGMTGPEMVQQLHATHPDLRIIFMSGYGEDAFRESFGADREFHFLAKPFTLNKLAAKVKDVFDGA